MNNTIYFLLLGILFPLWTWSTNFTSVQDGPWNDPATWGGTGIPNVTSSSAWPGDNVVINHAVSYDGSLTTDKMSSIAINGSLAISGDLNLANGNTSTFILDPGAQLSAGDITVSACCNTITWRGTVIADNLMTITGAGLTTDGATVQLSEDLYLAGGINFLSTDTQWSIRSFSRPDGNVTFRGGTLLASQNFTIPGGGGMLLDGVAVTVAGHTALHATLNLDGRTTFDANSLALTGGATVQGVGVGGIISFTSVSIPNGTAINCVNNSCNYGGGTAPPVPLDLRNGAQALPVKLLYFRGQNSAAGALLTWATASEADNDYFLLEHGTDGRHFTTAGRLPGQGNTAQRHQYNFTHQQARPGANYYRLRQFDFDGSREQLGVVRVEIAANGIGATSVYPNPARAGRSVALRSASDLGGATVYLYSGGGRRWALPVNDQSVALPTDLPSGLYYLQVPAIGNGAAFPLQVTK